MELDAKRSLQSELSFSNLPAELRVKIWETALEDREGRVIVPTLECIQPPHSSNATGIDCRCTGPELPICCQNYIIRPSVPTLLHVCRESRGVAEQIYSARHGGTSDPTRDKLLVCADMMRITSWCKIHDRKLEGRLPIVFMQELAHRHVLYYVPEFKHHRGELPGWHEGIQLHTMFRAEGRGQSMETITVLTNGAGTAEDMASFWSNVMEGWETFAEKGSEGPELIWLDDAATTQEVKRLIEASDRKASRYWLRNC